MISVHLEHRLNDYGTWFETWTLLRLCFLQPWGDIGYPVYLDASRMRRATSRGTNIE